VPKAQSVAYKGRKHYTNRNVFIVVALNPKFTYVLAGLVGLAHDAKILVGSLSRPDGIQLPCGKLFLGDARYACRRVILPTFMKTGYHMNELSPRNRPQNANELFNPKQVSTERAFATLKNRFKSIVP
jgi:hypothetical protein